MKLLKDLLDDVISKPPFHQAISGRLVCSVLPPRDGRMCNKLQRHPGGSTVWMEFGWLLACEHFCYFYVALAVPSTAFSLVSDPTSVMFNVESVVLKLVCFSFAD